MAIQNLNFPKKGSLFGFLDSLALVVDVFISVGIIFDFEDLLTIARGDLSDEAIYS